MAVEKMILSGDSVQMDAAMRIHLADISMACQVLLRRIEEEKDRDYLCTINRAVYQATHRMNQIELGRKLEDENELRLVPATVDLVAWVRDVTEEPAELLKSLGIDLVFTTELPALVTLADGNLLEQMLLELLSNAAKVMPEGGTLRITLQNTGRAAVLSVGDEGSGLSDEALERLFGDNREPDLSPNAGAGLGLRLARAVAEAHGGLMMLDTAPGRGVRVAVSLPLQEGFRERLRSPEIPLDARERALHALADVLPNRLYGRT